jgi:peptidoglycan/LPS O-acetylase OafA/YrhL
VTVHRGLLPLGLLLALAATFALPWRLLRSRVPRTATSYAVGWLAVLLLALVGRPEGDYVVASDLPGYVLVAAGLGLVAVGVLGVAGPRPDPT